MRGISHLRWPSALVIAACLGACQGEIGDAPNSGSEQLSCSAAERSPGPAPLRRLTPSQYTQAIRDLFGVDVAAITAGLPQDDGGQGWSVRDTHLMVYQEAAETTARQMDAPSLLSGCDPASAECLRQVIERTARLVYRRPLADPLLQAEVSSLLELVLGFPAAERIQVAVEVMLQSPWFLLRPDIGTREGAREGLHRLEGHEIATRLSLLLRGTVPDAALLDAADAGELDTAEGLRARAELMLNEPAAGATVRRFARDWLRLSPVSMTSYEHPLFSQALSEAAVREIDLLSDEYLLGDQNVFGLLTSDHSYVDQTLAPVYGLSSWSGVGFQQHTWEAGSKRRGLFGTAAFAMATSHANRTSPTLRGQYVRSVLLCSSLPPPPPDAQSQQLLSDDPNAEIGFRIDPANGCSGCHRSMDGIGLGLEQFDNVGRLRDQYPGGYPIPGQGFVEGLDASEFEGADQLGPLIANAPGLSECLTQHLFRWSFARDHHGSDACTVEELSASFSQSGHRFRTLMLDMIASEAFRYRIAF